MSDLTISNVDKYMPTAGILTPSTPNYGDPSQIGMSVAPTSTSITPTGMTGGNIGNGTGTPANASTLPTAQTSTSSPGSYKGVAITPGTDAQIQAQMKAIDAKQATTVTNPGGPSSSATLTQNQNTGQAITSATTSTPVPSSNPTANEQAFMDAYGVSLDTVRATYGSDAAGQIQLAQVVKPILDQKKADDAVQAQEQADIAANNAKTAQANAQEDENMRELQQQLDTQKQGATTQMRALEYAANPYAATTSTTSANQTVLETKFNQLQTNLNSQYALAKQSIANGDVQAYNTIVSGMYKSLAANRADTNNLLDSIQKSQQQNQQFTQTMTDKYVDDYQTALSKNQYTSDQISAMSDTQILASPAGKIAQLQNQTDGTPINAASIRADLMSAQIANEKLQNQTNKTNSDIARSEILNQVSQANYYDKLSAQSDLATLSSVGNGIYTVALRDIQNSSNMTKEKSATALTNLAATAATGSEGALKNSIVSLALSSSAPSDVSTYIGLQSVADSLNRVKAEIATLPASQQSGFINGNIQTLASTFGQNPDPKLQTIGQELKHLSVYYAKAITGVRGAASAASGNSAFNSLVPNMKDTASLTISDIQAFNNTANDILNGVVRSKLPNSFDTIFPDGNVLGGGSSGTTGTAPVKGQVQSYNGGNYTFDGTQWNLTK